MEIRRKNPENIPVKAVVLDFDGTLSTLRSGWEQVMRDMMVEYLGASEVENITQYIERSAGIQTIHQMKWLKDRVQERTGKSLDAWDYKDDYNQRLMLDVDRKKAQLAAGQADRESFLMAGAVPFLKALRQLGVHLHVASGTDQGKGAGRFDCPPGLAWAAGLRHRGWPCGNRPGGSDGCPHPGPCVG